MASRWKRSKGRKEGRNKNIIFPLSNGIIGVSREARKCARTLPLESRFPRLVYLAVRYFVPSSCARVGESEENWGGGGREVEGKEEKRRKEHGAATLAFPPSLVRRARLSIKFRGTGNIFRSSHAR